MGIRSNSKDSRGIGLFKYMDGKSTQLQTTRKTGGGSISNAAPLPTGGEIVIDGTTYYHVFASPGVFNATPVVSSIDYLVVAGGGSGGGGTGENLGAGAGGVRAFTSPSSLNPFGNSAPFPLASSPRTLIVNVGSVDNPSSIGDGVTVISCTRGGPGGTPGGSGGGTAGGNAGGYTPAEGYSGGSPSPLPWNPGPVSGGGGGGAGGPAPSPNAGGGGGPGRAIPGFPGPIISPGIPAPVRSSWQSSVGPTGVYGIGGGGGSGANCCSSPGVGGPANTGGGNAPGIVVIKYSLAA